MAATEMGPELSETLAKARTEEMGPPSPQPTPSPQPSPSSRSSTPQHSPQPRADVLAYPKRNNTVSHVMLGGIPIVCLTIDAKERLCLAQISNTLLKAYSYNEIHNRRVALGITCVQCTPVQLEILRRAGAMPISSRRCGMITKREAERLVKSFLEETSPPKLPENFSFDVTHECGWGCRGNFVPSRYNSSRAKCIKCAYCNMFFSPNKFIFHFHRTPEGTYNHPDAANFNSWRRHLKLTGSNNTEELSHAWEDVKAMFNGGSRKRVMSSSYSHHHHHQHHHRPQHPTDANDQSQGAPAPGSSLQESSKRPKLSPPAPGGVPTPRPHITSGHPPFHYPVFPVPSKMTPAGMKAMPGQPPFGMPYGFEKTLPADSDAFKPPPGIPAWSNIHETLYPPYEMIWAKHLGLPGADHAMPPLPFNKQGEISPKSRSQFIINTSGSSFSPNSENLYDGMRATGGLRRSDFNHASAFKPVGGHPVSPGPPDLRSYSPIARSESVTPPPTGVPDDEDSDNENVDVDTIDDDPVDQEKNNNVGEKLGDQEERELNPHTEDTDPTEPMEEPHSDEDPASPGSTASGPEGHNRRDSGFDSPHKDHAGETSGEPQPGCAEQEAAPEGETSSPHAHIEGQDRNVREDKGSDVDEDYDNKSDVPLLSERQHIEELSKEQLQRELELEIKARRSMADDCRTLKETFQEQVEREKHYRDEMAKQLQIVRETLCHELDQERKVRFSLQQKLKEAHDALHNFSCKMLASRQCSECTPYEKPIIPR